jgi:hypothetical protein
MPLCNKGQLAGIISGGSATYATAPRDAFFGITSENRDKVLNGIIDTTVFRMVNHERNLATRVMSLWRKVVPLVWQHLYGVVPFGFEAFVVEEDQRKGALYKRDNWTTAGQTVGSAKSHVGLTERRVLCQSWSSPSGAMAVLCCGIRVQVFMAWEDAGREATRKSDRCPAEIPPR